MFVKLVIALTVSCAVISTVNSDKSYDGRTTQGYGKYRGKYSTSQKFYSRPPNSNRGHYTPSSKYRANDDYAPYSGNLRPPKVSKIITNEGLGAEDINDIVKHLSKGDLDSIIEFAGESDKDSESYHSDPFKKYIEISRPSNTDFTRAFSAFEESSQDKYFSKSLDDDINIFKDLEDVDSNYNVVYEDPKPFSNKPSFNKPSQPIFEYVTQPTPPTSIPFNPQNNLYDTSISALQIEESKLKAQIEYLQSQIKDGVVYTDSKMMPEEELPKPMNLREEQDADASFSNNVPKYVRAAPSNSYKVENFGNLPLMDYNSKLDTVSSYHVPHYTVTTPSRKPSSPSYSAPAPQSYGSPSYGSPPLNVPPVESAPPPSAAKAQSDAHLKAVRIWSHKSKGTAYTLHDDGTLSLDKPKGGYGYGP